MIMRMRYLVLVLLSVLLFSGCEQFDPYDNSIVGEPVNIDFVFGDGKGGTRAVLETSKVVYVTIDKVNYYKYTYDDVDSRWECNEGSKLTWTGNTMKIYAIARSEGESVNSTSIYANQRDNGLESSDFLACCGTFTYTSGTLKMTLEHKVAKLLVRVSNCVDASKMTCETISTSVSLDGSISLDESDISITPLSTSTNSIKLYRSGYNTSDNTVEFVAYMLPQEGFDGKFLLKCGSLIEYHNAGSAIDLKAGKTTQINIALANIQKEFSFYPVNASGAAYASSDNVYEGTYQTFIAPCTAYYKLEVYGAQGGTYTSESNAYKSLCYLGDEMFSPYDNAKLAYLKCKGGLGAYATGVVQLNKGDILYVYVGKQPSSRLNHPVAETADPQTYNQYQLQSDNTWLAVPLTYTVIYHEMDGGWNGGGASVAATLRAVSVDTKENVTVKAADGTTTPNQNITILGVRPKYAGGGGGATDISVKSGTWDSEDHLYSRIIVAGGGGGGCYYPREQGYYDGGIGGGSAFLGTSTWNGGNADGYPDARGLGGTLTGTPKPTSTAVNEITATLYQSAKYNYTGTNSAGETFLPMIPHTLLASFGYGGSADWGGEGLGAGGGGWYGGSYGTGGYSNGGGGGGSSYAYTSEVSYNGKPLNQYHPHYSTDGYIPDARYLLTNVQNQGGVREGDGFAKITLLAE